ncbi:MAG: leucine-rich repeat protein [Lachnospiraceae bacterium]|nr:leucine-rich repeat protein [Lachnospiraceae bacterium]
MQKNKLKRFLASLCTVAMLSQTFLESGVAVYAADTDAEAVIAESGTEEAAVIPAEEPGEAPLLRSDEIEETDSVSDDEPVTEEGTSDIPVEDGEDTEISVDSGDLDAYGTFADGTLTVSKECGRLPKDFVTEPYKLLLEKVVFEPGNEALTVIDEEAFVGCVRLKEVDFKGAEKLTEIQANAFDGCKALKSINLYKVQFIDGKAFQDCVGLTEITFPTSIIQVDSCAFYGCTNLAVVNLESSNMSFGTSVFLKCKISKLVLNYKNTTGDVSSNRTIPEQIFSSASFDPDIPFRIENDSNIVEISKSAFEDSDLKAILLPAGLTTIAASAFAGCKELVSVSYEGYKGDWDVTFPGSFTTIRKSAFQDCTKFERVYLPDSINLMEDSAFMGCSSMVDLRLPEIGPFKIADERLGEKLFYGCTELKRVQMPENDETKMGVYIPDGYQYVPSAMFGKCEKLVKATFSKDVEYIGESAFYGCTALQSVVLPENENYTEITDECFAECGSLRECVIREGIKKIGAEAFYKDASLVLGEPTEKNPNLKGLPHSLEVIDSSAFEQCKSISRLTLWENVKALGSGVFAGDNGIKVITVDSDVITECGRSCFYDVFLLDAVFNERVTKIPDHLFDGATWATDTHLHLEKYTNLISVGDSAFKGESGDTKANLVEVLLPEGLKEIDDGAFFENVGIAQIFLPESLERIGDVAFYGCKKLEAIDIPENVSKIGSQAFAMCSLLKDIRFRAISVNEADSLFEQCNVTDIVIGENVTMFPDGLFKGAQFSESDSEKEGGAIRVKDKKITLYVNPRVRYIGAYSLTNIVNLKEVIFIEGSQLEEIGQYAFSENINLESINVPEAVKRIGNDAFRGCTKLGGELVLPDALELLGSNAFEGCVFTKLSVGKGLTEIPAELMINNTHLTEIVFAEPSKVEVIGNGAFSGCENLEKINFPTSLKEIGREAFKNCKMLTKLVLPEGLEYIGREAFAGCTGLLEVTIPATVDSIGADAFIKEECEHTVFLVVPGSYADKWLKENGFTSSLMNRITYELYGGVNSPENPASYKDGESFELKEPTYVGAEFQGWYLDPAFTKPFKNVSEMEGDFTVYAKWKFIVYTISYELNGGSANPNPKTYTVSTNTIELKAARQKGFAFAGWFTDADFKTQIEKIEKGSTGDLVLYAKWIEGGSDASAASPLDNTPVIDEGTTEIWLVKGQKFNLTGGWALVQKSDKSFLSVSSKGAVVAKKKTAAPVMLRAGSRSLSVNVTEPVLTTKKYTLNPGQEAAIALSYDKDHLSAYWYSENPDVAKVDQEGNITAVGKGSTKVVAYINGKAYSSTVKVQETNPAAKTRTLHMIVGTHKKLSISKVKSPSWISADPGTASMEKNKVTANKVGTTTLTCTDGKTGETYEIELIVEDINLKTGGVLQPKGKNKYTLNLNLKGTATTTLEFLGVDRDVVLKSSKPNVAYVDEYGEVILKETGKTKFTVKLDGKTVTVNVEVR